MRMILAVGNGLMSRVVLSCLFMGVWGWYHSCRFAEISTYVLWIICALEKPRNGNVHGLRVEMLSPIELVGCEGCNKVGLGNTPKISPVSFLNF